MWKPCIYFFGLWIFKSISISELKKTMEITNFQETTMPAFEFSTPTNTKRGKSRGADLVSSRNNSQLLPHLSLLQHCRDTIVLQVSHMCTYIGPTGCLLLTSSVQPLLIYARDICISRVRMRPFFLT